MKRTAAFLSVLVALLATEALAQQVYSVPVRLEVPYNQINRHVLNIQPVTMHTYEDKVYGFSSYWTMLDESTNSVVGELLTFYTNDKQVDGDTLCTAYRLLDGEGRPVVVARVKAGVNASFGGLAPSKRLLQSPFSLPLDTFNSITTWEATYENCNRLPDKAICAGVMAGAVFAGLSSDLMSLCGGGQTGQQEPNP